MRSSVASRNRIGPTQHRPIGGGKGFEARRQSACYHTSAGSSACRRKTGQGTGLGERFHEAKSGSHSTLRWREKDSNPRSPVRETTLARGPGWFAAPLVVEGRRGVGGIGSAKAAVLPVPVCAIPHRSRPPS